MSVIAFLKWCEQLGFSQGMRDSVWKFATVQAIHLCVMAVLAGALLIVDLRLLGTGLKERPLKQVAQDAQPWLVGGLLAMAATGLPQFVTRAQTYYSNPIFWTKMSLLLVAVIFTFTLRRWVTLSDEARLGSFWPKVVGLMSLVIWTSIAFAGRLVGFY